MPTRTADQDPARIVARSIEEDIALGRLRPRERLIEDDLIQKYEIKRHIARQVLAILESMGVVRRERNKGATVRDFTPIEVEQIYAVRELLEQRAAELFPLPADPRLIEELKSIHQRHMASAAAGDMRSVFRENIRFHSVLFSACGNHHLAETIELFAFRAHAIRSYTILAPNLLATAIAEHGEIIDSIERQDRAALCRLVVAHIKPAKEAYLHVARQAHPAGEETLKARSAARLVN